MICSKCWLRVFFIFIALVSCRSDSISLESNNNLESSRDLKAPELCNATTCVQCLEKGKEFDDGTNVTCTWKAGECKEIDADMGASDSCPDDNRSNESPSKETHESPCSKAKDCLSCSKASDASRFCVWDRNTTTCNEAKSQNPSVCDCTDGLTCADCFFIVQQIQESNSGTTGESCLWNSTQKRCERATGVTKNVITNENVFCGTTKDYSTPVDWQELSSTTSMLFSAVLIALVLSVLYRRMAPGRKNAPLLQGNANASMSTSLSRTQELSTKEKANEDEEWGWDDDDDLELASLTKYNDVEEKWPAVAVDKSDAKTSPAQQRKVVGRNLSGNKDSSGGSAVQQVASGTAMPQAKITTLAARGQQKKQKQRTLTEKDIFADVGLSVAVTPSFSAPKRIPAANASATDLISRTTPDATIPSGLSQKKSLTSVTPEDFGTMDWGDDTDLDELLND